MCIRDSNGIALAAKEQGIEVLKVVNDGVFLQGYKNGFLGGASFSSGNSLFFTGDISVHEDYFKIKSFAEKEIIYIKNVPCLLYTSCLFFLYLLFFR